MATVKLPCPVVGCPGEGEDEHWQTGPLEAELAKYVLKHGCSSSSRSTASSASWSEPVFQCKMDEPVLKSGIDEAEWSTWVYNWEKYKMVTGVPAQLTSAQLYACMEEDLKNDVQKYNPEVNAKNMTEAD